MASSTIPPQLSTTHSFSTTSGRLLHGQLFPGHASSQRAVVMLGALAAPQRYLHPLAQWLADRGYGVLTFDYRGVGASIHSGDPTTNLDDWADDARAALRATREAFQARKVLVVAHSIGGMLLGHAGIDEVDGALLLAATQGAPSLYRGWGRLRIEAAYRALPRIARALGELPGWPFLMKNRVPRDVIVHWARWGQEGRFSRWSGEPSADRFAALRGPLIGVRIADDDFAPIEPVDALLSHFRRAGVRREVLDPARFDRSTVRHFGLFGKAAPPWARDQVLRWLRELEAA